MSFLATLRRLAVGGKLPFILAVSPPLRCTSPLVSSSESPEMTSEAITRQMRSPVRPFLRRGEERDRGSQAKQKEVKKRGFNAIIRWCAYHQNLQGDAEVATDTTQMDAAVLDWLNRSAETFSCGQCLVVVTFLCEVLRQQTSSSDGEASRNLVDRLTETVALLLTHVVTSDQLDIQPFFVLLAAVYGLHRVTDGNPLQLSPLVLESLTPPAALWVPLRHQLATFVSVPGDRADAAVHLDALLTACLLFNEANTTLYMSRVDSTMEKVMDRLAQMIQPSLKALRRTRASQAAATAADTSSSSSAHIDDVLGLVAENDTAPMRASEGRRRRTRWGESEVARTATDENDDASTTPAPLLARNTIRVEDCRRILWHAQRRTAGQRVDLLEYLLEVVLDPATLSRQELSGVPALLAATRAKNVIKSRGLADRVIAVRGDVELQHVVPLLPFTNADTATAYLGLIEPQLRDLPLSPKLAVKLLCAYSQSLPWEQRVVLLQRSLADTPELLSAVEATLRNVRDERTTPSATAAAVVPPPPQDAPTRVLLSPLLCVVLHLVFHAELSPASALACGVDDESRRTAQAEALAIAGTIVRCIDWQHSTSDPATIATASYAPHADWCDDFVPRHRCVYAALTAYMESHNTYHFLGPEDHLEDRTLLNALVVPVLRHARKKDRHFVTPLLHQVLHHLTSAHYKRQLLQRAVRYNGSSTFADFFSYVVYFIVPSTELRVFPAAQVHQLSRYHSLVPRHLPPQLMARINVGKAFTTTLTRCLRFWIEVNRRGEQHDGERMPQWREVAEGWCGRYFIKLQSYAHDVHCLGEDAPPAVATIAEGSEAAVAPTEVGEDADGVDGEVEEEKQGDSSTAAADRDDENDDEDATGTVRESAGNVVAGILLDDHFTASITDSDVEAVLTLMLQAGLKASSRTLSVVSRRLRERMPENTTSTTTTSTAVEERGGNAAATEWAEGENIAEVPTSSPLLPSPPLPAHFVFAVRADAAVPLPLSSAYLELLLTACDLRIFHHVLSAWFAALKRRRPRQMLRQDMECAALALDILQRRLAATAITTSPTLDDEADHNNSTAGDWSEVELSDIAFKSLVHLLYHLAQLPSDTVHLRQLVEAIHSHKGEEATGPAAEPLVVPSADGQEDGATHDTDETADALRALRTTHGKISACVLQVTAFLTAAQLKELALAHLHRLTIFIPEVAAFAFLQLRPQLSGFTQRELLQVSTQYPAGWADTLDILRKTDLHASVDVREFVSIAKKLPMPINEAILRAHEPTLTMAWVTRVLSTLAARHEEVSLPLLQMLLARVEAVASTATESDKNLILLILQGYLLFGPATPRAAQAKRTVAAAAEAEEGFGVHGKHHATAEDQLWTEQISQRPAMTEAEQQQRVELVRHCCDELLSLEAISTLAELRSFLTSYPPSLHRLREQGVLATVEQKLLPAMLAASLVQWVDLDNLVRLLAEHGVLKPSTVQRIMEVLFTPAALSALQQAALANMQSDGAAVLTRCLRIAVTCADATGAVTAGGGAAAAAAVLMPAVEATLEAFDEVSAWLAALAAFVLPSSQTGSTNGTATAATSSGPVATGSQLLVARRLCELLLSEMSELSPSEFARLLQGLSRIRAWDLVLEEAPNAVKGGYLVSGVKADFQRECRAVFERADAHSRCVLARALSTEPLVFRCFEAAIFRVLLGDIAVLSAEDLEVVLTAALSAKDVQAVEQLLDTIGTRLLPMVDQCRRSTLVRLLQCHATFHVDDKAVVAAVVAALDKQSPAEVKLDAAQVIIVLHAIVQLPLFEAPERLVVLCFARLERVMSTMTPVQLYHVGQLILDLEMDYIPCVQALVTFILESRDGPRAHRNFHAMAETLCDVYEVEIPTPLRTSRLRKRVQKKRCRDFYAAQQRVRQEAMQALP